MFLGSFPVVSEAFIVHQITGLLQAGQEIDIYADTRGNPDEPIHPDVAALGLLAKTTFMDMPQEMAPYELPAWPLTGQTWPPGSAHPLSNWKRWAQIAPRFMECLVGNPRLTWQVLNPRHYGYRARSLSSLWRLHRLIQHTRSTPAFSVLHAHFGPVGESFRFARDLWRAPLVVSFHGYDYCTLPRREGLRVYEKLFAAADALTVNSIYTRTQLERLGAPMDRVHVLPVGFAPEKIPCRPRLPKAGEPVRLLTVARLVPIKGQEWGIRALAELHRRGRDVEYHLVGDGPSRGQLKALSESLGIADRVFFHGSCAGARLEALRDSAHLFLLTSVTQEGDQEGQGLALQEAQAAGLPVIATRHGAFPEGLLPGQSGFLVPERDLPALVRQLEDLLDHPETWRILGEKGRDFARKNYSIETLTVRLLDIYEQAGRHFYTHLNPQNS